MSEIDLLGRSLESAGLSPSPETLARFREFASLLAVWNQEMNLVSRKDPYAIIDRHILDSLGLVVMLELPAGCRVMDLGSGAGFPGLPMAILRPDIHFTSVESKGKKTRFQQEVIKALGLDNVTVCTARAESLPAEAGPFDWVVSRAVAELDRLVKWSLHLIRRPGGRMAVIKGPDIDKEIIRLSSRSEAWGIEGWDVKSYQPFENIRIKESRLVIIRW